MRRFSFIEEYVDDFSKEIALMLIKEHPQTIALIFSYISENAFEKIIQYFDEDYKDEIYLRMLNTNKVNKKVLDIIEKELKNKIKKLEKIEIIDLKDKKIMNKFYNLDAVKLMKLIERIENKEVKSIILNEIKEKRPDIVI